MCSSPKDRGVKKTHYKHQHSYNDVALDKSHHYAELANAAQQRREDLKHLEERYKQRHKDEFRRKPGLWQRFLRWIRWY